MPTRVIGWSCCFCNRRCVGSIKRPFPPRTGLQKGRQVLSDQWRSPASIPSISLSVATSSMCSASIFFSFAFSASSAFSRLASDTSMPPYFERHL